VSSERYVLLGLAPPRAAWFDALAQWVSSATIAADFVKCVSVEEVRSRLASGRRHSALLIDSGSTAFDRDVVDAARAAFTPVIVVRGARSPAYSVGELGVAAELPHDFALAELLDVLTVHCQMIGRGDQLPPAFETDPSPLWLGQLYVVCGPGGTGTSTLAIALAQGLAADARYSRRVLLADLARRADLAMLHDARDLGPGVQELVEAHRLTRLEVDEVWRTTFDVPRRGYRLLLGLRKPEAWSALRPRAIDASLAALRRSFQVVVADVTGDVEGEAEGGSIDVEERNYLARAALLQATVVLVVGAPGIKGIHSLAGLLRSLTDIGVSSTRLVPVVNQAPRNPRSRAELARALAAILAASSNGVALAGPVHVPERKLEDVHCDGKPLPTAIGDPLVRAVRIVADRQSDAAPAHAGPARIGPGSLGTWPEAAEYGTGGP
jgi:MinD-like ATPase involved in chromosome partitioning or flagellar assembly